MRTILNFGIEPIDQSSGAPAAVETAHPIPVETAPLFQSVVAARPAGAPGRWARSLAVAVSLHVVLLAGFAVAATTVAPAQTVTEPEVVFYSFPPLPPPPPALSAPKTAQVQARRIPRPDPVIPKQVKRIEEKPVEEPKAEEPVEEAPAVSEPAAVAGGVVGGVAGGVQGGVVGGTVGGTVGGMVGATTPGPLQLSQVSQAPRVLHSVRPDYPRAAKLAGVEGLVVVQVVIGTDGVVEKDRIRIIRSVPGLDASAIAAVSQYRFTPALGRDGRPARVMVNLPLQFNLR